MPAARVKGKSKSKFADVIFGQVFIDTRYTHVHLSKSLIMPGEYRPEIVQHADNCPQINALE